MTGMNPSARRSLTDAAVKCVYPDLQDELARIDSEITSLALRHGISHAADVSPDSLIRCLRSMVRASEAHDREVSAVRASLLLGDAPERHNSYPRRAV